jgi:hypothetical protein
VRLSAWRAAAPHKDAATAKVAAVVDPILHAFGAEPDPHCWVVWGDEPSIRYSILVPTDPGLVHAFVRVHIPGEGPRATTKLVRWNRVAIGELAVETQAGHRLLSFQVEQQVLRGVDVEADRVAAFALRVISAIDGRPLPAFAEEPPAGSTPIRRSASIAGSAGTAEPGPSGRSPATSSGDVATRSAGTRGKRPSSGR